LRPQLLMILRCPVCRGAVEPENGKSVYFPGAWHVCRREQAARAIHQAKTAARQSAPTERLDGFVSYEVSPLLARDTDATIKAAHRYWKMIDRPNLMIKVPSTPAGIPAVEQLIQLMRQREGTHPAHIKAVLQPELIVRASVAAWPPPVRDAETHR